MKDHVELKIDNRRIENFLGYTIEADIYTADDAFTLDLANPEIIITKGQLCEIWVNGNPELKGIVDRIVKSYNKQGVTLKVEGRDLCGLLVDSCCEEFISVQNTTVKALAERLIRTVPFIKRSDIIYQENIRGNLKKKKGKSSVGGGIFAMDGPHTFAQIEPGQTVFEVLKVYAASRGMMFFAMPDGTFVFGKPKDGGEPVFTFINKKSDPKENNVLEGSSDENISRRYSKITVVGQQQGVDSHSITGAAAINTGGPKMSVTDPTFPFYKPLVVTDNNDARSPKLHAQMLMEKQKYAGFQISYRVPFHSQNGENYKINEICHIEDEVLALDGDYLIYGRSFEMSKQGSYTTLKIGLPGMSV